MTPLFFVLVILSVANSKRLIDPFDEAWNYHGADNEESPLEKSEYNTNSSFATSEKESMDKNNQKGSIYIPASSIPKDIIANLIIKNGKFPSGDLYYSFKRPLYVETTESIEDADYKYWWKGPNVCVERDENIDDREYDIANMMLLRNLDSQNCSQTKTKYECFKKTINKDFSISISTVRYKCCDGFVRFKTGRECQKIKNILDTIDEIGAKDFRKIIQLSGVESIFDEEGNFTFFAPIDSAFQRFIMNYKDDLMQGDENSLFNTLVLTHSHRGVINLEDYLNEDTISNNETIIRFNAYPSYNNKTIITANCAKITSSQNLASNGVVHLIDGVITPATHTIQDIIKDHPQLTDLQQIFENTGLFKDLTRDGHYTVFAPTDEAFSKLKPAYREKLLRSSDSCGTRILKHHITSHTVCSSAIVAKSWTHNMEADHLKIERNDDNEYILEDKAKIIQADIMATNGVIHLIDAILIPDLALPINDVLKKDNLTMFHDLIKKAELEDEIDNGTTLFAPSNRAFEDPKIIALLKEIDGDKEKLRNLVFYHTLPGRINWYNMHNNALLKSDFHDKTLRLNFYSTMPIFKDLVTKYTINCAAVTGFDENSCGSVIHKINRVLLPPTETILELINKEAKYATLKKIIKGTDVEKILQENQRSITFLAPTNEIFAGLNESVLKTLLQDKEKANIILKNHILTEVLCCSGAAAKASGASNSVSSFSHQRHKIEKIGNRKIRIGRAVVTSCDNLAVNGVLHSVNKVLLSHKRHHHVHRQGVEDVYSFLFGF